MPLTLADAWVHTLSPFLVRFTDTFGLRWYGLSYAAGFVLAWVAMRVLAGRGVILIPKSRVADAMMYLVIGVVAGGRLGYVLFYEPSLLWTFTGSVPFWGLFNVQRGGMASHGGMIGVVVACWFISRGFVAHDDAPHPTRPTPTPVRVGTCPVRHVMDAVAFVAPVGLLLGRLANFVNGELLGKIVSMPGESSPWWAVKFPQELSSAPIAKGGHAPPLSDELETRLTMLLMPFSRETDKDFFGPAYDRMMEVLQHGPAERVRELSEQLAPVLSARHPSQLYQAAAEGLVLGAVLIAVWAKPRLPGVVAAWFLITYGVLRVVTEFWRLPDANLTVQRIAGLSRGQWLSVVMVAVGIVWMAWILKRCVGEAKLGGWMRRAAV